MPISDTPRVRHRLRGAVTSMDLVRHASRHVVHCRQSFRELKSIIVGRVVAEIGNTPTHVVASWRRRTRWHPGRLMLVKRVEYLVTDENQMEIKERTRREAVCPHDQNQVDRIKKTLTVSKTNYAFAQYIQTDYIGINIWSMLPNFNWHH